MSADGHVIAAYQTHFARSHAEVVGDLKRYESLLHKWQKVQNLVSRETLDAIWSRHFADSLQVLKLLHNDDRLIIDLGSGGGFPALPLAIALKGTVVEFVLVEPNGRKVSFLRAVARELGLAVRVEPRRSDELKLVELGKVNVVTARAVASLTELCTMARPLFGPGTRAIFHKGREHLEELAESRLVWDHDVVITPSDTDPNGVLLELSKLSLKNR